jgi:hypothetical protein
MLRIEYSYCSVAFEELLWAWKPDAEITTTIVDRGPVPLIWSWDYSASRTSLYGSTRKITFRWDLSIGQCDAFHLEIYSKESARAMGQSLCDNTRRNGGGLHVNISKIKERLTSHIPPSLKKHRTCSYSPLFGFWVGNCGRSAEQTTSHFTRLTTLQSGVICERGRSDCFKLNLERP